ncbi:NADPH:quinone reductase-like Zn-dependent oxidoreductase [Allocatelliglobosispora scoriae]|uniref:NADPH:quinone reductase-like Zn-dependent oxidoreductase n=1 Tax=Allocatelliglobosispora scoriae TaxID=643052 RepID=A0A841C3R9_9ACTN|nr:NAD(P)-dependent alcohol dehydrogenase [Allocatelliglobosispora scoriae]MBB5874408.1 NADPH:quinone reductase-like Zn-dependent oxidoreductase [Allocatelliglobosispora scoriae]
MRAIVYDTYGTPGVLRLAEVPTPVPAAGEVLIRVRASTVGPADCAARQADPAYSRMVFGLFSPRKPILGSDLAGEVAALGAGVTGFAVGDRVLAATGAAFGTHAEYALLPQVAVVPTPDGLGDADAAALIGGGLTALPFLRDHGRLRDGQRILINGASGAVGTAAVQLAKHFGASVTAVCSTTNLDLVRSLGADEVIDHTREDFTRLGGGFDVVFDAVGKSSFARCRGLLKPGGAYLTTVPSPAALLQTLWTPRFGRKRVVLAFTGLRSPAVMAEDLAVLTGLAAAGRLRAVIDRSYPLEQVADAHRYVDTGRKRGAVVVTV